MIQSAGARQTIHAINNAGMADLALYELALAADFLPAVLTDGDCQKQPTIWNTSSVITQPGTGNITCFNHYLAIIYRHTDDKAKSPCLWSGKIPRRFLLAAVLEAITSAALPDFSPRLKTCRVPVPRIIRTLTGDKTQKLNQDRGACGTASF